MRKILICKLALLRYPLQARLQQWKYFGSLRFSPARPISLGQEIQWFNLTMLLGVIAMFSNF
jgi:hypothetical protein